MPATVPPRSGSAISTSPSDGEERAADEDEQA